MNLHSRMTTIRDTVVRLQQMIESMDEALFLAGTPAAPTTHEGKLSTEKQGTIYTFQSAVGSIEDFLLNLEKKLETVEYVAVSLHNRVCQFRDMTKPEEPMLLNSKPHHNSAPYPDSTTNPSNYEIGNTFRRS